MVPGLAGLLFALAACTPAYNWREVHPSEGGYAVLLPARPVSMARDIDLDGLPVTMTMTGARVGDTSFTIGVVVLPDEQAATRDKAIEAMRVGMTRNLAGHETRRAEVALPVTDAGGRPLAMQAATRVEVDGRVAQRPTHMAAQFVARGHRAWQVVVIGPIDDPQSTTQFLDSFRIIE